MTTFGEESTKRGDLLHLTVAERGIGLPHCCSGDIRTITMLLIDRCVLLTEQGEKYNALLLTRRQINQ